jgi:hypothetical protein
MINTSGVYIMELSKQEYLDKFSLCAIDQDLPALEKIRSALLKERKVMDKWFDKYLDMFDRKMNPEETDTPIWKLYKSKSREYSELNGLITTSNAYINKLKNV